MYFEDVSVSSYLRKMIFGMDSLFLLGLNKLEFKELLIYSLYHQ